MTEPNQTTPLTARHRIGYALGDFGGCMTFGLMAAFTTRYYINVAMIDTAVIAVMTLIWKFFDALANPFVGVMLDKSFAASVGKRDKFRPWIIRMAPMLSVCAILVFTAPGWVDGMARLAVAFSTYLMYEAVYAIHVIAFAGLISGMATNDDERAQLSSARGIGGSLGGILPQVLFPRIIEAFEGDPQLGYGLGVTVCAAIGLVLCICCYLLTEERNPASRTVNAAPIRITDIVTVLTKNRAVLALCLHGMLQGVLMAVSGSLGTYMYADVLGRLSLMSTAAILGLPVTILFMSFAPRFSRRLGSETVLRGSLLLGAALYVGLFILHALTSVNIWVHIAWNAVASGMANLSNMMQWGMLGESIEYNEYLTGKRTEGSIYGTFNMLRRAGQGLGAATGVALLGLIGYDASLTVQSGATILGIKALCLLFPALCTVGSWLIFRFLWNITPQLRQKIAAAKMGNS